MTTGRSLRPRRAVLRLARIGLLVALGLLLVGPLAGPDVVGAEVVSPSPVVIDPGDPRSEGEGPGLVGSPLLAAAGVIVLGVAAAGATLVYLRLTRDE